jgi:membrane associated rhomboid family serine protease
LNRSVGICSGGMFAPIGPCGQAVFKQRFTDNAQMTKLSPARPRATSSGWAAFCVFIGLGALAVACFSPESLSAGANHPLAWQSNEWGRRAWTLWTAAWVHLSWSHLAGNLLALAALGVLGHAWRMGAVATGALVLAWPLSTVSLVMWPQVSAFAGLSAWIHAAALVLAAQAATEFVAVDEGTVAANRPLALAMLGGLAFKLITERAWHQPVVFEPNWGFNVVVAGHLGGAFAGLLAWSLVRIVAFAGAPFRARS